MRRTTTILWVALALLIAIGLVLVYSASTAEIRGALPFIKMQSAAAAVGLAAAIVLSRIDYRIWQKFAVLLPMAALCVAQCLLALKFHPVKGSRRWLRLGSMLSIQPSELARVVMVIVMSAWYAWIGSRSRTFLKGFLYPCLILGAMAAPVAVAPDLGASVVIAISCGTVMFAAKVPMRYLLPVMTICVVAAAVFIMSSGNRRDRILTYRDALQGKESSQTTDYHRRQSLEAFVRGGPWGVGIGESLQKHKYLPEANTDFIFSIAGEELGLIATLGILSAFAAILVCGFYIAYHAPDRFGRLLALGLTTLLTFEAAFNIGMVTGCLPTKGLTLPFISYGGTSMASSFVAIGLILSVAASVPEAGSAPLARDICRNV